MQHSMKTKDIEINKLKNYLFDEKQKFVNNNIYFILYLEKSCKIAFDLFSSIE
jgi:hypothetical protein